MNLSDRPVVELYHQLVVRDITAEDIVNSCLTRIDAIDDRVHAFVRVDAERAVEAARLADEKSAAGEMPYRVEGIPYGLKDNMVTKGWATTCGSRILDGYVPQYDATVVERLDRLGAIVLGKTNMDEFAFGSSTESSAWGPTRNPWDMERVPGGSSGGSAAAVAAGMVPFALGSDTGGSIRQPAALCGVVGMKPTYGRVSRYGLVAFASSLDQIGPFTRSVLDCAAVLELIAGHDPRDSTSVPVDVPDYTEKLDAGVFGMRIGYVKELMSEGLAPEVALAVRNAIHVLERLGADIEEVSLPSLAYSVPVYYLVAPAEASSNLARFDGVRYGYRAPDVEDLIPMYEKSRAHGFGAEAKRRIMLGTYALSAGYYDAYYGQAQKVRTLIARDFAKAFETYDVLLSPTAPTTAFKLGEKLEDPLSMYLSDICTIPVNLAGIPAISVPCGIAKGLPVGLQVMGKHFDEQTVLQVAQAFETEFKSSARPPLLADVPADPPTTMPKSEARKFAEFAAEMEAGFVGPGTSQDGEEPPDGEGGEA
jgi:aspartyl-tRNA(Asn)/glutamyl-tRNA(Gln) amidotransferase subunit A